MGRLWSSLILRCRLQDVRLNTFLRLLGQVGEMGPPVAGGPWAAKEAALFSAAPRPAEEGTACVVVRRPKFRAGRLSQYMTKPGLVSRAFLFLRYDHYLGLPNRALHPTGPSTTIRAKHTLALRVGAAVGFVSFSGWLPAAFHANGINVIGASPDGKVALGSVGDYSRPLPVTDARLPRDVLPAFG